MAEEAVVVAEVASGPVELEPSAILAHGAPRTIAGSPTCKQTTGKKE